MKKIYERYIKKQIKEDLKSTMVFIGGPRQVGKTTFALNFLSEPGEKHPAYLNWDDSGARSSLLKGELPANQKCIILDEIHKFARWRNLVKGFYDTNRSEISFIITGSARLDYYCFRISPYGPPKTRAVKKERKLYLWDWSIVPDPGARFENFIASQLLKYCHFIEDTEGFCMELRFLRDTDKREINFIVLKEGAPLFAVECKAGDKNIASSIYYFMERTPIPKFYQVHGGDRDYEKNNVRVIPVHKFCRELGLP